MNRVINFFRNKCLNKQIRKYRFVHLMYNDKFNKPVVDFLNRNFNTNEHIVLCRRLNNEFPFPEGENVIEISHLKGLDFKENEKIICHSLFDKGVVKYLYKHQKQLQEKAYWVVWGGDLYNCVKNAMNDYVRKNFRGYMFFALNDKNVLLKNYGHILNENFYPIEYPLSLDISKIEPVSNSYIYIYRYLKIQINNSCDESTLEMLDILSKFKNENIKIIVILSYGKMEFKNAIIQKGKDIFADKFEYIENYLSPEEYAKHIASLDIFIANQNRQQATANIDMCLYFGKKVYIKSTVSTFDMYTSLGYEIFDTYSIKDMDFDSFVKQSKNANSEKAKYYISDEYRKKLWENVLND